MPKAPKSVQFCPPACLYLVLRGEGTDRCKKGYWKESDPNKAPLWYVLITVEGGIRKAKGTFVVKPPDCEEGR